MPEADRPAFTFAKGECREAAKGLKPHRAGMEAGGLQGGFPLAAVGRVREGDRAKRSPPALVL